VNTIPYIFEGISFQSSDITHLTLYQSILFSRATETDGEQNSSDGWNDNDKNSSENNNLSNLQPDEQASV